MKQNDAEQIVDRLIEVVRELAAWNGLDSAKLSIMRIQAATLVADIDAAAHPDQGNRQERRAAEAQARKKGNGAI